MRSLLRCEHDWTNQLAETVVSGGKTAVEKAGKCHPQLSKLKVKPGRKLPSAVKILSAPSKLRPAIGRITIQLVEAMALPPAHANGKADPYCRVSITGYSRLPEKPSVEAEWTKGKLKSSSGRGHRFRA